MRKINFFIIIDLFWVVEDWNKNAYSGESEAPRVMNGAIKLSLISSLAKRILKCISKYLLLMLGYS
jgi:hypothetical protein